MTDEPIAVADYTYDPMHNHIYKWSCDRNTPSAGTRYIVDIADKLPTIIREVDDGNRSIINQYFHADSSRKGGELERYCIDWKCKMNKKVCRSSCVVNFSPLVFVFIIYTVLFIVFASLGFVLIGYIYPDIKSDVNIFVLIGKAFIAYVCIFLIFAFKFRFNGTMLHYASFSGRKTLANWLIKKGAKVNCRNKIGQTPLHYAVVAQHKSLIALLILSGADVNAKDDKGNSPLHYAVLFKDDTEIVQLLIQQSVDINTKNLEGATPLNLAKEKGLNNIVDLLRKYNKT